MKAVSPLLLALVLPALPCLADDQIVTLGDSLTFAYKAEFGFQTVVFGQTVGDGANSTIRNWTEILNDPLYRKTRFDFGADINLNVNPPGGTPFVTLLRQNGNFAIPGLKVDGMREFVAGTKNFVQLVGGDDPDFNTFETLIASSDYDPLTDFTVADFENQVTNVAERVVIAIGGNDIRGVYATIYDGNPAGTFIADFIADMTAVIDRVQTLKPGIQIVLVNVPHVGITPKVRASSPYDPVKTERVSAVLRDLNSQLFNLSVAKGIGYADIYTATLPLIDPNVDLCIQGLTFNNVGTTNYNSNLGPVWLNGQISKNFHPSTNGQTQFANEIIKAFNRKYNTGIPMLSATEMLVGLLGKTASAADMQFFNWRNNHGLSGATTGDDSDGDGVTAWVEYATGLNPLLKDGDLLQTSVSGGFLNLAYPIRIPTSNKVRVRPESSANPGGAYVPFVILPTQDTDGLYRAKIPVGVSPGFLRLKGEVP